MIGHPGPKYPITRGYRRGHLPTHKDFRVLGELGSLILQKTTHPFKTVTSSLLFSFFSNGGNSVNGFNPKCCRNSGVVWYRIGRPGPSARPPSRIRPLLSKLRITELALSQPKGRCSPRGSSPPAGG